MISFNTAKDAVSFIKRNSNTGKELTLNEVVCFGMGVYAYRRDCEMAGIDTTKDSPSVYHHLSDEELLTLVEYLGKKDGYLAIE